MNNFEQSLNTIKSIIPQVKALSEHGATSFLVGGCTRDLLLGIPIHDLDIEVHGIEFDQLRKVLNKFGVTCCTGKQFMVIKTPDSDADWAIPRLDGSGRKPEVTADKNLDITTASKRRDLTVNAITLDLNKLADSWDEVIQAAKSGQAPKDVLNFQDPYDGQKDLENKVLSAVDEKFFVQDPLRFFRVMQMHARFEMTPDDELNEICSQMAIDIKDTEHPNHVSAERINEELKKMILKSRTPSMGLKWVAKARRLQDFFPELAAAVGIQKDAHPDKDVFGHLCQALDAAAQLKAFSNSDKLTLCLAAMLHDLGQTKNSTSQSVEEHEGVGAKMAEEFLTRLKFSNQIIATVSKLVKNHEAPNSILESGAKEPEYKLLASKLSPETNLAELAMVALFDQQGLPAELDTNHWTSEYDKFVEAAKTAGVLTAPEPPVLSGKDLVKNIKPGPEMGKALKRAYQIQICEGIKDKETLLDRSLKE